MSFGFGFGFPRYLLAAANRDAAASNLEVESGFNLLLEDGGYLLLEG